MNDAMGSATLRDNSMLSEDVVIAENELLESWPCPTRHAQFGLGKPASFPWGGRALVSPRLSRLGLLHLSGIGQPSATCTQYYSSTPIYYVLSSITYIVEAMHDSFLIRLLSSESRLSIHS